MKLALSFSLPLAAALSLGFGVVACGTPAEDADSAGQNLGSAVDVPNPSGAYFASVSALGTGCPAGTFNATISEDGQEFLVTFAAYEATVWPGVAMSIKDCTMMIDLRTPRDMSFTVTSFRHVGFGFLSKSGMTGRQTAKYYFQGNPVGAQELRTDMLGPYDDVFEIVDDVLVADQVWSPCGAQRRLNVQTRLVLQNDVKKRGNGFLDIAASAGQIDTVFSLGLAWKHCGDDPTPQVDAGPADPPPAADAGAPAPVDPAQPVEPTRPTEPSPDTSPPPAPADPPGYEAPPPPPADPAPASGPRVDQGR